MSAARLAVQQMWSWDGREGLTTQNIMRFSPCARHPPLFSQACVCELDMHDRILYVVDCRVSVENIYTYMLLFICLGTFMYKSQQLCPCRGACKVDHSGIGDYHQTPLCSELLDGSLGMMCTCTQP